jgi:hypothetical protein
MTISTATGIIGLGQARTMCVHERISYDTKAPIWCSSHAAGKAILPMGRYSG